MKIVLLWTSNHFLDFDTEPSMSEFLEKFEVLLEGQVRTEIRSVGEQRLGVAEVQLLSVLDVGSLLPGVLSSDVAT